MASHGGFDERSDYKKHNLRFRGNVNCEEVNTLQLWGGVECTVNRVQDTYFDQLKSSGHDNRIEDLNAFSEIGLRTLRYPFLWERIAPEGLAKADWSWPDRRLARLQELKIRPIAGFVHHGSGPKYTHLLDPKFSEKLRDYAAAFAQRYPWIEDYTPLNELFTTARFSGLYGIWYPHKKTSRDCFQILIHECRATVLAMEAIRKINPKARLIQTDDLGKTSSTSSMKYQADFENERRWLGWDLLCGRVNVKHPLWRFIIQNGINPKDLIWFSEHPCPPDLVGINHYLLSNRYLDEKLERYPTWSHGSNGYNQYADIEAVRVGGAPQISPQEIFKEAWERYKIPIAITEVHLNAPPEGQIRWFMNIWESALKLRKLGIPIKAVTAWGLLGHFDWHCLVSRCEGYYESGVFDLRSPTPRPTVLAKMIKELTSTGSYEQPTLNNPGWWQKDSRISYPEKIKFSDLSGPNEAGKKIKNTHREHAQPLLITGARGTLGQAFARVCESRGLPYRLLSRDQLDIAHQESIQAAFKEHNPWAIINTAGFVRVDEAEVYPDQCFRENLQGPVNLAKACASHEIPF
ncbi:MAG: family 1 glycosylhydrolase, partial [Bdellovibrionia bacterium]